MTDAENPKPEEVAAPVVLTEPTRPEPSAPAAPAPVRRRGGFIGSLLGGVIAAGAGFGLAHYVPQGWPLGLSTVSDPQIAAQATEIAALKAEVERLAALPAPVPDTALADRIAALESATPAAPDLTPLEARITTVEQRLAAIETVPVDGSSATPAAIAAQAQALAALQADVQALKAGGGMPADLAALAEQAEARLKEAEARAEALKAETEALGATSRAQTALGLVMAAMDSGAPFAGVLPDLGEAPEALTSQAATGVPTLPALRETFPEAARLALEAALREDMGATWAERIGSFLQSQTGARSLTPRDGTDPDAVLSRAEAALAAGDLAAALTEVQGLPEVAQTAMADWRTKAEARQAALAALTGLAARIGG